ncbi:MAG: cytoplasmic protein [Candidatus Omnitrophica bacterium]|nr:cytoplasmic protein [Candidatus Omnitrophota bacterium]MCM8826767.1 cytoplasmic protein [Candidatus Omnitrophota bacterium]
MEFYNLVPNEEEGEYQYKDFIATRLYCYNCKLSVPVKERLLLILPDGYLYQYVCERCGEILGDSKKSLNKEDKLLF